MCYMNYFHFHKTLPSMPDHFENASSRPEGSRRESRDLPETTADRQTDRHTNPTTVTLAAHARRGLIIL